ncbi:hypothetical protein RMCBS344292_00006 [Rhizopus microsporus]|nr:hypothetical protein RMCBS344292_00006 [Rhizopus microsporus]
MAAIPKDSTSTRAKLGTACYRCRGFRHACDRAKPSCSRCQRRGIICTYPEAAPTLKKLQKATETLGDRIKKFGDLLKTTGEHNHFAKLSNNNKGISLQWLAQSRSTVAPSTETYASSVLSAESDTTDECPDLYLLAKSCITNVHVDYHINKILLYQAFSPVDHFPTTSTSLQALHTCLNSAHTITIIINNLVSEQDNQCNVPFFGLVFANMVYIKLLSYPDDHPYRELARQSLIQSLDTLKRSKAYIYDIDMSTNLLHVMEQDAMQVL